ncbi:MFS transporter [bacterium]|nr:MAG: MFS transporter [bacterium]
MTTTASAPSASVDSRTFLGHPPGLLLLFFVEMWERFSYYGMRGLLVLYLVAQATGPNPGRGMSKEIASNIYGWYAGMAYLLPVFGGLIADKLIGTHRSLVTGGLIIALGHIALAASGLGALGENNLGLAIFISGMVLIVIGTGHFKPNVSVMVGELYTRDDPRRDGAFTIFYMGINLGAFLCSFVCGTLGEKVGWHWGFGAAAVGMLLGLALYLIARPRYLATIGNPPEGKPNYAPLFFALAVVLSLVLGASFYLDAFSALGALVGQIEATAAGQIIGTALRYLLPLGIVVWGARFVMQQEATDRGPTFCILLFIFFNAVFWLAFEQAGTSLNLFAAEMTERHVGGWEMPATWFQSVGAFAIIVLAPIFASLWAKLARHNRNPGQPVKIAIGLFLLGLGYVLMVFASLHASPTSRVSMFWLIGTYTLHTLGELCISPTGLSFVTRVAPVRYVSFLMGMFFLSSSLANLIGGILAGQIEKIESGQLSLFWFSWFRLGGQADFFLLFVFSSFGAGLLILLLSPFLNKLLAGRS